MSHQGYDDRRVLRPLLDGDGGVSPPDNVRGEIMLLFKRLESEQPATPLSETHAERQASLLPERTSEELLAELQDLVNAHGLNNDGHGYPLRRQSNAGGS